MSSIYRKGRDGYFYYQTYIYNPETGKKNKRVFHALGTKEREVAEKKQFDYDLKYEGLKLAKDKKFLNYLQNLKIPLLIFTASIFIFFLLKDPLDFDKNLNNQLDKETFSSLTTINPHSGINKIINKDSSKNIVKTSLPNQEFEFVKNIDTNQIINSDEIVLPNYTIIRTEVLSKVFNQIKIYITINGSFNSESLLAVCEKIYQDNQKFSNLVICLFSNSAVGKSLAMGNEENISSLEKKEAWLAMYTFNPVEGAYFDDKPSGYLGVF